MLGSSPMNSELTVEEWRKIKIHDLLTARIEASVSTNWCGTDPHRMVTIMKPVVLELMSLAWDVGYEASDHEAYFFSTHGKTDNPYREALDSS